MVFHDILGDESTRTSMARTSMGIGSSWKTQGWTFSLSVQLAGTSLHSLPARGWLHQLHDGSSEGLQLQLLIQHVHNLGVNLTWRTLDTWSMPRPEFLEIRPNYYA
jgi:hypothetical protein